MDVSALYKISYGLYIVTSASNGKKCGQVANSVFQVTSEPVQIAACLNKENTTHSFVKESGVFGISVLELDTPMQFIGRFGFRKSSEFDKFEGVEYKTGKTGVPLVTEHAVAVMEAKVVKECDVGTHTLFIGEVVNTELVKDAEVLTYADYHLIKKGKTPRTATVYFEDK
ncbi:MULTISPECIES: flavin reductase family protein [unclassified Archaeoglobus]|jgi:ferric-chelate reductase [NAD(P)H]|uniref:flavin reductase family protein n=1 Tax=unclassified Archaeoglobus TaxID=2643606 RepID=UPI0025C55EEE|nr:MULTISPECIES: flavin reductase family protein [unclassified Archaeoglobus]